MSCSCSSKPPCKIGSAFCICAGNLDPDPKLSDPNGGDCACFRVTEANQPRPSLITDAAPGTGGVCLPVSAVPSLADDPACSPCACEGGNGGGSGGGGGGSCPPLSMQWSDLFAIFRTGHPPACDGG